MPVLSICDLICYVAVSNSREQAEANDLAGMLLQDMGMEPEPNICTERLISITPGIGTHFLTFQWEFVLLSALKS